MKTLSIPEQHQLRIAQKVLREPEAMTLIMGGMTKAEAVQVCMRAGQRFWHYFTAEDQAIYTTSNPARFEDYVAIVPQSKAITGTSPITFSRYHPQD